VHLQALLRPPGPPGAPQLVGQRLRGYGTPAREHQQGEARPLALARRRYRPRADEQRDRSEQLRAYARTVLICAFARQVAAALGSGWALRGS
jgi:hypothetical protein